MKSKEEIKMSDQFVKLDLVDGGLCSAKLIETVPKTSTKLDGDGIQIEYDDPYYRVEVLNGPKQGTVLELRARNYTLSDAP
jgi:hypothetical protein